MTNPFPFQNQLCFIVFPYVAILTFFFGSIRRYRKSPFTYSSLSSQLLENRIHFWGLVSLHYGILVVLAGHLVAFLLPRQILGWDSQPLRLYILEIAALIFGLLTIFGLVGALARRLTITKARVVTTGLDWFVLSLLLVQSISGVYVAIVHPWGSAWFAAAISPYLWSLVRFNPDLGYVSMMPVGVQLHILMGFVIVCLAPFTRLVHILVAPVPYIWRRPQVVRWYRPQQEAPEAKHAHAREMAAPARLVSHGE